MPLLGEQERIFADELEVADDSGLTGGLTGSTTADWTTQETYSFTTTKALTLMVKGTWYQSIASNTPYDSYSAGRILVDDIPIYSTGGVHSNNTTTEVTRDIYVYLASGSHTVKFENSKWKIDSGTSYTYWTDCFAGVLNLNDSSTSVAVAETGSTSVNATTVTLVDEDIILDDRVLPVGSVNKYTLMVNVNVRDSTGTPTRRVHPQDDSSVDTGHHNVTLWIDDTQVAWTDSTADDADGNSSNPSYGKGADMYYLAVLDANQTVNIKVKDTTTSALSANAGYSFFVCPWVTPATSYEPVSLDLPDFCTLYVTTEPLYDDTTKSVKIGEVRFKSHGDSTDYYYTNSGTGILESSFTFEQVNPNNCPIHIVSTTHICVSYVGVDIR